MTVCRGRRLRLRTCLSPGAWHVSNSAQAYAEAGKDVGFGRANLVMTLDRKGDSFGRFFQVLFQDMFAGTSMPMAWVKLAPQRGPKSGGKNTPWTIFACELGQLAFR